MVVDFLYTDVARNNCILRTFKETVPNTLLVWHRDYSNRTVQILSGNDWKLQLDNQLPQLLVVGESYYIPKETYHRLIKGANSLQLQIS